MKRRRISNRTPHYTVLNRNNGFFHLLEHSILKVTCCHLATSGHKVKFFSIVELSYFVYILNSHLLAETQRGIQSLICELKLEKSFKYSDSFRNIEKFASFIRKTSIIQEQGISENSETSDNYLHF